MTPRPDDPNVPLVEGDRVVIIDKDHPHYTRAGWLEPTPTFMFPWQVRLGEGGSCCVDEHQIRRTSFA